MDSLNSPQLPVVHSQFAAVARSIERPLMRCLEAVAAVLVATDIVILLIGVIARYAFHSPLIWTDDLAQAVFLWLGMIGANGGSQWLAISCFSRHLPRPPSLPRLSPSPQHASIRPSRSCATPR